MSADCSQLLLSSLTIPRSTDVVYDGPLRTISQCYEAWHSIAQYSFTKHEKVTIYRPTSEAAHLRNYNTDEIHI